MEASDTSRLLPWKIAEEKTVVIVQRPEPGRLAELLYTALAGNLTGLTFRLRQWAFTHPFHKNTFCDAGNGVVISEMALYPAEAWRAGRFEIQELLDADLI